MWYLDCLWSRECSLHLMGIHREVSGEDIHALQTVLEEKFLPFWIGLWEPCFVWFLNILQTFFCTICRNVQGCVLVWYSHLLLISRHSTNWTNRISRSHQMSSEGLKLWNTDIKLVLQSCIGAALPLWLWNSIWLRGHSSSDYTGQNAGSVYS